MKVISVIWLFCACFLFSNCTHSDLEIDHKQSLQSGANKDRFELTIQFTPHSQRITGDVDEDQRQVDLAWESVDAIHLVFVQDGIPHYRTEPIASKDGKHAYLTLQDPTLDFDRPYDLYGFFGYGKWAQEGALEPKLVIAPTDAKASLSEAIKNIPFVFSKKALQQGNVQVEAQMLGHLFAMEVRNYTYEVHTVRNFGFKAVNGEANPIAYDPTQPTTYNFGSAQLEGTAVSAPLFTAPANMLLSSGERLKLYAYCLGYGYGESEEIVPRVVTAAGDLTESYQRHKVTIANYSPAKLYNITTLYTPSGLYTDNPIKPNKIENPSAGAYFWGKWMGNYPDNYPVFKMLIPGTHDSEALDFTGFLVIASTAAKCQKDHIRQQMLQGVRALDIRLKKWKEDLYVAHGRVSTNTEFERDVMKPIITFLNENPTEFIFMMIDNEGKADYDWWNKKVSSIMKKPEFYSYFATSIDDKTTLGELRGKIVLISRQNIGVYFDKGMFFADWGDNSPGKDVYMAPLSPQGHETQIWVQDNYKGISTDQKVKATIDTFTKSIEMYYNHRWTINYSSLSGINVYNNAASINPAVMRSLDALKIPFHGIIYTDFITVQGTVGIEYMRRLLANPYHQL